MWNEAQLDEALSAPGSGLIKDFTALDGDIMILGAGGKIGPTLAAMAKSAVKQSGIERRVIAVSRFSDPYAVKLFENKQIECIPCDLTRPDEIARLPKVKNIIYMAGRKFGTSGAECETWEMNAAVPAYVTQHFEDARYVVFSTSNIYPFASCTSGGNTEDVPPSPIGEYAISCLGRERIFEYAAKHFGAKVLQFRLSYAIDLRYGILYDICSWIMNGKSVPLAVPAFNCVWQRYANEVALRSLLLASENVEILNVTGPELVSVRSAATRLGQLLGREVKFEGEEGEKGILCNSSKCVRLFGYPDMGLEEMMEKQAEWVLGGGRQLNKPTHFEESKGKF